MMGISTQRRLFAVAVAVALVSACGGKDKKAAEEPKADPGEAKLPGPDVGLCDVIGKRVTMFDLNRDRTPDVWKVYEQTQTGDTRIEVVRCKQVDFDHDGRKDYVVEYDDRGGKTVERFDFDFDGRFDAVFRFDDQSSRVTEVERDSDFDGRLDLHEDYDESGVLKEVKRDRNRDGSPDLWEQYVKGQLVAILYDDNFDSRVDRREEVIADDDDSAMPLPGERLEADEGEPDADGDGAASDDPDSDDANDR